MQAEAQQERGSACAVCMDGETGVGLFADTFTPLFNGLALDAVPSIRRILIVVGARMRLGFRRIHD